MTETSLTLAKQLGLLLQSKDWQITCAESCTGGGLGYAITSTSGSSQWFKQGFITYSNEAKQDLLGVTDHTLASFGAVSEATVTEMAYGAAYKAQAQVAISVSGIAGPDGGSEDKPVGTVWFGFVCGSQVRNEKQLFSGDRHSIRAQAIEFALQQTIDLLTR
jgi:nicotinamide-nucleotide amidase